MEYIESPRRQHEGHWSPAQSHRSPSQSHSESYDRRYSTTTPKTADEPFPPPPIIPQKGLYYEAPASHDDYSAPEVADPYMLQELHSRPLSPGGSTLFSPAIPHSRGEKHDPISNATAVPLAEEDEMKRGIGKRTLCVIISIVTFIILGLGLGLGLAFGLKHHKSRNTSIDPYCRDNPQLCIGGALGEQFYSKKGAFNGSGIALAGESWNKQQRRIFTLFFQHWTGDIRFMQYTTDRKWIGGTKAETVATDAKNATALSTVAYSVNSTQYFHLFYVSKENKLRQIIQSNVSTIWEPGPLSKLDLKVYESPGNIGLQACWKGNYYGDSDFSKFPTWSGEMNKIPFDERLGMNIWYPIDDSTFQQYAWYNGADQWAQLDKWTGKSTRAGVGCYSWGEGTTTYAMMANKNNDTEIWWKDTNTTMTSEENHPINSWRNATKAAISSVYPTTSYGYTTYFYAQMADKSVRGFNISFKAENTSIVQENTFTITDPAGPVKGLGGTHLTNTAYAEKQGEKTVWDSLYVFYQTQGDDITAFTRPIAGGEWTKGVLTIPDQ